MNGVAHPFDALASSYADVWSNAPDGRAQRQRVWNHTDKLFRSGGRVLDLGCGIGDDALHLAARQIAVDAVDASTRMVEIARSRGVAARVLKLEELGSIDGAFSGALSNFGTLNCVTDLHPVAENLARMLETDAPLALCVMGRFCWRETIQALAALDFPRAARRWRGRTQWRGIEVHYWSAREIASSFAPYFRVVDRIPIGGGDHQLYTLRKRVC